MENMDPAAAESDAAISELVATFKLYTRQAKKLQKSGDLKVCD